MTGRKPIWVIAKASASIYGFFYILGVALAKRTKSKKKAAAKKTAALQAPSVIGVRAVVDVPDGTPSVYANFMEISNSPWDFSIILAKLPAKPAASKIDEIRATGVLPLTAEITINFPPTLITGLIRALTTQKEIYEKMTGVELKEIEA